LLTIMFVKIQQLILFYSIVNISKSFVTKYRFLDSRFPNRLSIGKLVLNSAKTNDIEVDVCVLGGGIAGSTISWLLQERENCKVALVDPKIEIGTWYPNYGEWRDEWHTLSDRLNLPELKDCTTNEWEVTECFFGGSNNIPITEKTSLDRPYVRVDRIKMQNLYRRRFKDANGITVASKLSSSRIANNLFDKSLLHDVSGSTLTLDNGNTIRCKVVIDATGLESKLVAKEDSMLARGSYYSIPTGFQIAYGFIATVDKLGPYNFSAMTLFDYRTDHLESNPQHLKEAEDKPTFMYAMPLSANTDGTYRVFWEETSLVGKGKRRLTFEECKRRALLRLEHHGIKVSNVEEEEYCYIPMGGELPDRTQRVIGFGGAANMVHPSTGYHACRMLAASTDLSKVIGEGIRNNSPSDKIAADAYRSIWSQTTRGQRDFQAFGGDFLMAQNVNILRGFFSAFFRVDLPIWGGFLAGWPGLPGNIHHETWDRRLLFALNLFTKMSNEVRLAMMTYAVKHTATFGPNLLLRSLTPPFLFGSGPLDYEWVPPSTTTGDEEAKAEARRMIQEFEKRLHSTDKAPSEAVDSNESVKEVQKEEELVMAGEVLDMFPAPFN